MKERAPSFPEWVASSANPISGASETAQYFAHDALRSAFDAGMKYQKRLTKEARARYDGGENIFDAN